MSLQVWLPLTGDLHNQGLSEQLTFSAINTLTFNDNGKIGKCYQRAATDTQSTTGININSNLLDLLGTEASVAMWVKPLGTHTHYNGTLLSSGNWNAKRWAFGVSQNNTQVDVLCGGYNTYINCTVPVNEWTHLCSTFNNGISKLYKNGIYIGELTEQANFDSDATNTCIGRETYASGYFGFNGLINDVRIYNHVLSPKEVEEISKGLILHYKLDNNGMGGKNLLTDTDFNNLAQKFTLTSGTEGGFRYTPTENEANTVYTISCYLRGNANINLYLLCTGGNISYTWINRNELSTDEYQYFTLTFTSPDTSKTLNQVYICTRYGTANSTTGDWFEIKPCSLKMEKGNLATFWSPAPSDLNLDTSILYDSSGYNNNGTIVGSLQVKTPSTRYSCCTTGFTTSNYIISTPLNNEAITGSIWFNIPNRNNQLFFYDSGSGLALGIYSNKYLVSCKGAPFNTVYDASTVPLNTWIHATVIKQASSVDLYINGVKQTALTSGQDYWTATATQLQVSGRANSYPITGLISDFRIYATALSAEQIKELHNTSMSIDSSGNVHAREVIEL